MPRILLIDTAPFSGGAQRSFLDLVEELNGGPFAPIVASGDAEPGGVQRECRRLGIPCDPLVLGHWPHSLSGACRALPELWRGCYQLRRLLSQRRVDLVYANGIRSALLCTFALPRGLPLVYHHRDFTCPRWALRRAVAHAQRTVVASEFIRRACLARLDPALHGRFEVIPNGLDLVATQRAAGEYRYREQTGFPAQRPIVALVADMLPWKRHRLFIDAFALARAERPDLFAFVIGGTRDDRGEVYEEALFRHAEGLGLLPHLAFTGAIDSALPLLDAADVVLSVAENEPFGRSVLEALTLGKPVVVTPGGGPAEIVAGCAAAKVVAAEAPALARAILDWLAHPDRAQVAEQARRTAAEFSLDRHAEHFQRLFGELCGSPAAPPSVAATRA